MEKAGWSWWVQFRIIIHDELFNTDTGESILSKIKEAVPERDEHNEDLQEFEALLTGQYKVQLEQWKTKIEAWEADRLKLNPFKVKSHGMCIQIRVT